MSTMLQKSGRRNLTVGSRTGQNPEVQCMDIDMLAEKVPPKEEKEQIMPGLLTGMTGGIIMHRCAGKSAIGLQMAMAVAKVIGANSGTVLYVPENETLPVIRNTLSWVKANDSPADWNCIRQNLKIAPVDYYPSARMLDRHFPGLKLLVLDRIDLFYSGEDDLENTVSAIGLLHQMAEITGAAMLFTHSENRQNYIPGLIDRFCSARFDLTGMNESEALDHEINPDERRKFVRLANTKSDYTIPDIDRWFKKSYSGMLESVRLERRESPISPIMSISDETGRICS